MDSGATDREVLERKLEKKLQDPTAEPVSLPLEVLKAITCDFSPEQELGRGAYGVVYKGVLQSGKVIAVKKIKDANLLDLASNNNNKQFENEITCHMGVRHQNVVQLVGYCVQTRSEVTKLPNGEYVMAQTPAFLLCFEFQCKGSLDKHVSDDFSVLGWDKRYEIIRGVCRGLHYLHHECHMVHLDLKPQNILMDAMMMPKIADFGLSRLLGEEKSKTITENRAGTLGYMAQEYIDHGIISYEADIFSLGVIIIEIITGRRNYPNSGERTETSLKHYIDEVVESWRNRLEITPMHMSLEMHIQQVEQCITIALKCLEPDLKKRPTSLDIVQSLNEAERPTSLDIVQSLNEVDPKCWSLGNPPGVAEKDSKNQNLQSQVIMNIINIPKTIGAINGLNECANLFKWIISDTATSSLKSKWSGTRQEKLQGDVWQLQSDLQCLSDTIPLMYRLTDRAEWRIHDHVVADLLSKLKDAVYDAEDLLDEFRWYEKKVTVEGNAISVESIINFFHSVTQGSFNKVTDIHKRLNYLSGQLEKMGLLQAIPRFDKSFRPETTAFPIEPEIFGRKKEKEKLIEMLGVPTDNSTGPSERKRKRNGVCSSASNQICAKIDSTQATVTSIQVLPIVGIGGVGKTTLAQDICNHSKVKRHFHRIIWICVSDDFDVKRLTKEAIEQSCEKVPKNDNLNFLQGALANSLNAKRFLLVLDDMWDEKKEEWKRFCAPFRNVLQGSMILVTTRSQKVADVVRTMDPFPLEGLNKDVFREFFKLCVFGSGNSNNYPELERIGEEILPKLKGSPLAAKTLGRLLGMSLDIAHWDRILKSQLWELRQENTDILPALRLSYMYLPSYLKRCFSFCAVYQKDYKFQKNGLAEIWAAEGLVEPEHTGDEYFEELVHLSFFQKYPRSGEKYVIHDLLHDMAQLVSKDECFIVKDTKDISKIPQNVRHLLVLKGGDVKCDDLLNLCKHRKLRTLVCNLSLKSKTGNTVMEKWCAELMRMRVMVCSSLSKWGLPGSISNMKHLRYLKILDSCGCKSLPAEFCCLYNMQLFYAKKWVIDDMPSDFGMLINLQNFESAGCRFYPIHSVDNRGGATDEGPARAIIFQNYYGESLPSGFHRGNLSNVASLGVERRDNVTSISFHIYNLTNVKIDGCKNLSSVEQFLQPAYVPNIKKIEIFNCTKLERVPTEKFGGLHFLEVLVVSSCPMIKSRGLLAPSLKKLDLSNSGDLIDNIECSSLTTFHLSRCPLEFIELQMWNLPSVQELNIRCCPSLRIIRDSEPLYTDLFHSGTRSRMGKFPLLTDLTIEDCKKLKTMDDLLCLPAIESIKIHSCGLQSLPANRLGDSSRLKKMEIFDCLSLDGQSALLLPSSLQKLVLLNCEDFSGSFPTCLEELTSLEELHIVGCKCIVSVPGHLWHSNLKSLKILQFRVCQKLKSIGGLGAIAHMTDCFISSCPELKEIDQPLIKGCFSILFKEKGGS